jgi:hypothetical protein
LEDPNADHDDGATQRQALARLDSSLPSSSSSSPPSSSSGQSPGQQPQHSLQSFLRHFQKTVSCDKYKQIITAVKAIGKQPDRAGKQHLLMRQIKGIVGTPVVLQALTELTEQQEAVMCGYERVLMQVLNRVPPQASENANVHGKLAGLLRNWQATPALRRAVDPKFKQFNRILLFSESLRRHPAIAAMVDESKLSAKGASGRLPTGGPASPQCPGWHAVGGSSSSGSPPDSSLGSSPGLSQHEKKEKTNEEKILIYRRQIWFLRHAEECAKAGGACQLPVAKHQQQCAMTRDLLLHVGCCTGSDSHDSSIWARSPLSSAVNPCRHLHCQAVKLLLEHCKQVSSASEASCTSCCRHCKQCDLIPSNSHLLTTGVQCAAAAAKSGKPTSCPVCSPDAPHPNRPAGLPDPNEIVSRKRKKNCNNQFEDDLAFGEVQLVHSHVVFLTLIFSGWRAHAGPRPGCSPGRTTGLVWRIQAAA